VQKKERFQTLANIKMNCFMSGAKGKQMVHKKAAFRNILEYKKKIESVNQISVFLNLPYLPLT
jgi:hypothetical protein